MIFKVFRNLAAAAAVRRRAGGCGRKKPVDDALLGAYDAYRAGDPIKFQRHARNLEWPPAHAVARLLAPVDAAGGPLQQGSARVLRHSCQPLRRRAPARRLAARARQALRLGRVRAPGGALQPRGPRGQLLSMAVAHRARRRKRVHRRDGGDVARARGAARGLPAPERYAVRARQADGHRRLAPGARAVRARPDHRGQDHARLCCRGRKRPTSASSPRPRASRSACSSACRKKSRAGRRAKSRCWPRCASRATMRWPHPRC